MMTKGAQPWALDLGAAAGCSAAILGAILAGGGIWEHVNSGDLHAMFLPWYEHAARTLVHEGRVPLWSPQQFCGTPVLGLGQTAALYPPVLLAFAWLPSRIALHTLYGAHIFILTLGSIWYARRHGIGRLGAGLAALLTVAGILRGPLHVGVDHPAFLGAMAWVPIVLYCWERAVVGPAPRWIGAFAVAAALQWLAGYPDFAFDLPVVLAVMALSAGRAALGRRLWIAGAGLALSAGLAAVQLLGIAEAVAESPRAATAAHEVFRSLFAAPASWRFGGILVERFGPGTLVLIAIGAWRPTPSRIAWLAALGWSLFALNRPLAWLYLLPPYSDLRFPFGWSGYAALFVGLLAAGGLATMWGRGGRGARALAVLLGVAALAHGLDATWRAPGSVPPFHPGSPAYRAPDQALVATRVRILQDMLDRLPRMVTEREAGAGAAIRAGIPMPNGHDPSVPPRRVVELLERAGLYDGLGLYRGRDWQALASHPDIASVLGTEIVVVPAAKAAPLLDAGFIPIGRIPPDDLVVRRNAAPRAHLVHRVIAAEGEAGTLEATVTHAGEARTVAIVERGSLDTPVEHGTLATALVEPPLGARETVRIVAEAAEEIRLDAIVAASALLILRDTFYPGWQATVDGNPVPIIRANHAFRAVPLDAGTHEVAFRYAPISVYRGAALSVVALAITLGALLWPTRQRSRAPAETA